MIKHIFQVTFLVTVQGISSTAPALADGMDFFFHNTPGGVEQPRIAPFPKFPVSNPADKAKAQQPSQPLKVGITKNSTAVTESAMPKQQALVWFEKFDDIIFTMGPSDHEKYILKRPINQEVERLNEWIDATNSLARKYRLIAKRIRAMIPSQSIGDMKEFQIESANWYDDNAHMCEELTAPRPPAKTYEELQRAYQSFMTRTNNLAELSKAIAQFNTKLREKYDVHPPKYTDEAAKYVDSVAHNIKEK